MPRLMFQRPRRIEWEELTPVFGRMVAEPFEKGYALTVGNSLRRVLLSAVPGAAAAWARVDGIVGEDLTVLLLNLKKIVVRLPDGSAATAKLTAKGPKVVTAGDLVGARVEILNPDLPLATLAAGGRLTLEVGAQVGRGYVSAERQAEAPPPGAIALDSAF